MCVATAPSIPPARLSFQPFALSRNLLDLGANQGLHLSQVLRAASARRCQARTGGRLLLTEHDRCLVLLRGQERLSRLA